MQYDIQSTYMYFIYIEGIFLRKMKNLVQSCPEESIETFSNQILFSIFHFLGQCYEFINLICNHLKLSDGWLMSAALISWDAAGCWLSTMLTSPSQLSTWELEITVPKQRFSSPSGTPLSWPKASVYLGGGKASLLGLLACKAVKPFSSGTNGRLSPEK